MGSSPLTRGKRYRSHPVLRQDRLIPAHAGKTLTVRSDTLRAPAHPRSRGENARLACPSRRTGGSSPLTRGKPENAEKIPYAYRLIPAHAGKTCWPPPTALVKAAHPRSRGENRPQVDKRVTQGGSSPLTRGKRFDQSSADTVTWLIPAHAGKTPQTWRGGPSGRAHPRSRGENVSWRRV